MTTATTEQIEALLKRRDLNEPGTYAWLMEAVELLLRLELERTSKDNDHAI